MRGAPHFFTQNYKCVAEKKTQSAVHFVYTKNVEDRKKILDIKVFSF
jgi:hypothetical protein